MSILCGQYSAWNKLSGSIWILLLLASPPVRWISHLLCSPACHCCWFLLWVSPASFLLGFSCLRSLDSHLCYHIYWVYCLPCLCCCLDFYCHLIYSCHTKPLLFILVSFGSACVFFLAWNFALHCILLPWDTLSPGCPATLHTWSTCLWVGLGALSACHLLEAAWEVPAGYRSAAEFLPAGWDVFCLLLPGWRSLPACLDYLPAPAAGFCCSCSFSIDLPASCGPRLPFGFCRVSCACPCPPVSSAWIWIFGLLRLPACASSLPFTPPADHGQLFGWPTSFTANVLQLFYSISIVNGRPMSMSVINGPVSAANVNGYLMKANIVVINGYHSMSMANNRKYSSILLMAIINIQLLSDCRPKYSANVGREIYSASYS